MSNPLEDIISKRGKKPFGGFPHNWLELFGQNLIEISFNEPSPKTFRGTYYYNARENRIYKKTKAGNTFVWKDVTSL